MQIGVLGAGVMGSGIAQVCATGGYETVCFDLDPDALTRAQEHVTRWHWASPAPVMRAAEIVRTRTTSDETVASVCSVASACGKNPIVIRDAPMSWGFVTNRVYFAMIAEAQRVVSEGVTTADEVDQLMVDCFRWPAGPFGMVQGATSGWG